VWRFLYVTSYLVVSYSSHFWHSGSGNLTEEGWNIRNAWSLSLPYKDDPTYIDGYKYPEEGKSEDLRFYDLPYWWEDDPIQIVDTGDWITTYPRLIEPGVYYDVYTHRDVKDCYETYYSPPCPNVNGGENVYGTFFYLGEKSRAYSVDCSSAMDYESAKAWADAKILEVQRDWPAVAQPSFYQAVNGDTGEAIGPGFIGGEGGDPPPGTMNCSGDRYYSCTCPDYAKAELPRQVPTAPSHYQHRTWPQCRPTFPCKHCVAAAVAEQDWENIICWAREARDDLPARELWDETLQLFREWRRGQRQRRKVAYEAEREKRRAAYEQRRADREQAADSFDRILYGRDLDHARGTERYFSGDPIRATELYERSLDAKYDYQEYQNRRQRRNDWTPEGKEGSSGPLHVKPGPTNEIEEINKRLNDLALVDDMAKYIADNYWKVGWEAPAGTDPFNR
jgi:hypothetical protein